MPAGISTQYYPTCQLQPSPYKYGMHISGSRGQLIKSLQHFIQNSSIVYASAPIRAVCIHKLFDLHSFTHQSTPSSLFPNLVCRGWAILPLTANKYSKISSSVFSLCGLHSSLVYSLSAAGLGCGLGWGLGLGLGFFLGLCLGFGLLFRSGFGLRFGAKLVLRLWLRFGWDGGSKWWINMATSPLPSLGPHGGEKST